MVDANRLPQVLSGSRADRLKRPIDAQGVWMRISRSNGIAEFPVRRDELTEEITPVQTLASTALQTAQEKLSADQVLALLGTALNAMFQEYPLTNGLEHREIDPIDNREYTYTVYPIQTTFQGTFEELALVTNDATETLLDVEYGVYKEAPNRIVLVFRDMLEGFQDGIAKIKLIGIPDLNAMPTPPVQTGEYITVEPAIASVGANTQITIAFTGFSTEHGYDTFAHVNGTNFPPVSDQLPGDIGNNRTLTLNAGSFVGQPLPLQLQIFGGDKASNIITINP